MGGAAIAATHRGGPSRRTVVVLSVWVATVGALGVLAVLLASAPAPVAEDLAVFTVRVESPVVIDLGTLPTTTTSSSTTTTAVATTLPESPPPTAAEAPAPEPTPRRAAASAPGDAASAPAPPPTEPSPPPAPPPAPPGIDAAAEQQLLEDHNQRRAAQGLPPLRRDPCLDASARDWSVRMASEGRMRHNPDYAAAIDRCLPWTRIGENVGFGPTAAELADRFWNSPEHRANVVGPYEYVGIGVVIGPDGLLWATLDFAAA